MESVLEIQKSHQVIPLYGKWGRSLTNKDPKMMKSDKRTYRLGKDVKVDSLTHHPSYYSFYGYWIRDLGYLYSTMYCFSLIPSSILLPTISRLEFYPSNRTKQTNPDYTSLHLSGSLVYRRPSTYTSVPVLVRSPGNTVLPSRRLCRPDGFPSREGRRVTVTLSTVSQVLGWGNKSDSNWSESFSWCPARCSRSSCSGI